MGRERAKQGVIPVPGSYFFLQLLHPNTKPSIILRLWLKKETGKFFFSNVLFAKTEIISAIKIQLTLKRNWLWISSAKSAARSQPTTKLKLSNLDPSLDNNTLLSYRLIVDIKGNFWTTNPQRFYPQINITLIQNPSRIYAIPLLGFLIKIIALIPVAIWMGILAIAAGIVIVIINPVVVLLTGKYWQTAYGLAIGYIRYYTKTYFYFFGLTNKYPGFSLNINDNYSVDIPYPQSSNRLYAIPFLGGLIRVILLIPYLIYQQILTNAAFIAAIVASIVVLFKGKYPESSFELVRDALRVTQGSAFYMFGLTDTYPSFYMSFNHQLAKIIYLTLGFLTAASNFSSNFSSKSQ